MPLYEYACDKCGKVFEVMQKFADTPLSVHEECGGKVERLLSAPALHFKGSGFYITDYAKGNGNSNAPKHTEGKHSSESGKSEGSKSEGSKSEGSKSDSSKSDGAKTEASKSDSGSSKPAPAPATTTSSSSDSKS